MHPLSKNANLFISITVSPHPSARNRTVKFRMKVGPLKLQRPKHFQLPETKMEIWGVKNVSILRSKFQPATYMLIFTCQVEIIRAKTLKVLRKCFHCILRYFIISMLSQCQAMLVCECIRTESIYNTPSWCVYGV